MRKISPQPGFFCDLLYSVLHPYLFLYHEFCLLPLLTPHNTNIHASCGIRTRNPRKRSASDPRLGSLGHWARQIRFPDSPVRSESLYGLSYPDSRTKILTHMFRQGRVFLEIPVMTQSRNSPHLKVHYRLVMVRGFSHTSFPADRFSTSHPCELENCFST